MPEFHVFKVVLKLFSIFFVCVNFRFSLLVSIKRRAECGVEQDIRSVTYEVATAVSLLLLTGSRFLGQIWQYFGISSNLSGAGFAVCHQGLRVLMIIKSLLLNLPCCKHHNIIVSGIPFTPGKCLRS